MPQPKDQQNPRIRKRQNERKQRKKTKLPATNHQRNKYRINSTLSNLLETFLKPHFSNSASPSTVIGFYIFEELSNQTGQIGKAVTSTQNLILLE